MLFFYRSLSIIDEKASLIKLNNNNKVMYFSQLLVLCKKTYLNSVESITHYRSRKFLDYNSKSLSMLPLIENSPV